jgi:hypothetical protein
MDALPSSLSFQAAPDFPPGGESAFMKARTIEELRALAKKLGLSGYSKLRKADLLQRIAAGERALKAAAKRRAASRTARASRTQKSKPPVKNAGKISSDSVPDRSPRDTPAASAVTDAEQAVESAKFVFAPPDQGVPEPAYAVDLGEDIDTLPALREPLLCLLPQKPGVLHAYWMLPPGMASAQALRLRLVQAAGNGLAILEEQVLSAERGHWYFHVNEDAQNGAVYLQLGRYLPDGQFAIAFERGMARIPNLYASTRTDRQWWVGDAQFRDMYRRAGGFVRPSRLGWAAAAPSSPAERLGWKGGISSQR